MVLCFVKQPMSDSLVVRGLCASGSGEFLCLTLNFVAPSHNFIRCGWMEGFGCGCPKSSVPQAQDQRLLGLARWAGDIQKTKKIVTL